MDPAATTCAAHRDATTEPSWQRRGVDTALRVLAVLVGVAGAAAGAFSAGLVSLFAACTAESTGICTNFAGVVPALEWAIVIVALAAPLAGGIASAIRGEWPWLPAGLAAGAVMVALAVLVSGGQTGTMA